MRFWSSHDVDVFRTGDGITGGRASTGDLPHGIVSPFAFGAGIAAWVLEVQLEVEIVSFLLDSEFHLSALEADVGAELLPRVVEAEGIEVGMVEDQLGAGTGGFSLGKSHLSSSEVEVAASSPHVVVPHPLFSPGPHVSTFEEDAEDEPSPNVGLFSLLHPPEPHPLALLAVSLGSTGEVNGIAVDVTIGGAFNLGRLNGRSSSLSLIDA